MLGPVMAEPTRSQSGHPELLDVVALLVERLTEGLARGQVGTVVEPLSSENVLVEFCDDSGRAYAVVPCRYSDLLVLHYEPEVA
jgi:hypothetical protein